MDTDSQPMGAHAPRMRRNSNGLSYKFQRLRERLRSAVASGELSGKLPGERTLARRFHVNAKTLSKALTDLAAEGLLDRSIGRGTYVKGQTPIAETSRGRWLILTDANRDSTLARLLTDINPDSEFVSDPDSLRPSFLKQFDSVVDLAQDTPEKFLRDLAVRNIPFVTVNREPNVYSVNMVGTDRATGANSLARDLILGGHTRLAVVQSVPRSVVPQAVQLGAARYGHNVTVQVCGRDDVVAAVRAGATAIVCDTTALAGDVKAALAEAGLRCPDDVSLVAVGCCDDNYPCSGHFVDCRELAKSVAELLLDGQAGHRPTLLWMATHWVDNGTSRPLVRTMGGEAA
jgi:hypothetical protein